MQERNAITLEYLDDGERIADFINVVYFQGEEIVHSNDVQEMDSVVQRIRTIWGKVSTWSYTRDFLRKIIFETECLLIGIEHQTDINLTMPVRVMGYDVGVYEKQIRHLKKFHRRNKDIKGYEFTSGISKRDRLIPVLTTVLYFGEEEWKGPRSLHEMMNFEGKLAYLMEWIPDYPIHIIEVRRYPHWEKFQSDLRQVFGYLQHIQNGMDILQYLQVNRSEYENLAEDTFDLLSVVTNAKELMDIKEKSKNETGGINMCKAIQELINQGRAEGRMMGWNAGQSDGLSKGLSKGRIEGEERMGNLVRILLTKSQTEELARAIEDEEYRKKLFEEYHL